MTETTKEQAIEKIARLCYEQKYDTVSWEELCNKWIKEERQNCWKPLYFEYIKQAEAILNALPIEFVDDETEPMEGDFIVYSMDRLGKYGESVFEEIQIDHDVRQEIVDCIKDDGVKCQIIQRNGKHAIHLNDIGDGDER